MPDTTSYLILGLAAAFGVLGLYVLTIYLRFMSAHKDMALIKQLQDD